MNKTLVSWYAFNHDFVIQQVGAKSRRLEVVNEDGPTFNVHQHFGSEYAKHVLLCSSNSLTDLKYFNLLVSALKEKFKHIIEPQTIQINDPINIEEIFLKISELLKGFTNEEIEIFVNPGTPQMQIAWYLAQPNFKKNVRLFQMRETKHTSKKDKPERIFSNIDTIFNPTVLSIANDVSFIPSIENKVLISESIKPIYEKALRIAQTQNVGCLILGENGTGKENLASFIHENSNRKDKKFIAVNCAAFSDELLRSELFGHEKGSFTGAEKQKIGMFEEANKGTIFLDEIGDISSKMQVSLLRVLQEKKIQRVGGTKEIDVDIRVVTATNKNLEELCEQELFRWDLFFRLAVTTLKLPPLRNWTKKEIKSLIEHFNTIYFSEFPNREETLQFSKEALDHLLAYHFKGNVRELQNLIISLYTFCDEKVSLSDLPDKITQKHSSPVSIDQNEMEHIKRIFESKKGNISQTARTLGISRDTLRRKINIYGIKCNK